MKKSILILLLLVSLGLVACNQDEDNKVEEGSAYKIYYIDSTETKLVSETYSPTYNSADLMIAEFLEAMGKQPKSLTYKIAKPETVTMKEYTLSEKGHLILNFDSNYSTLEPTREILLRAATVKTLCQIEGVEDVEFNVNGQPLLDINEKPIGMMRAEEFIDNSSGDTNYQNANITLFFANQKGNGLVETDVKFKFDGSVPMEQLIINQLLRLPKTKAGENANLYPVIPEDTVVIKSSIKEGVCYIDFNEAFLNKLPEITDEVALYSIVNSLVEMSSVNKVQFSINGETQKLYHDSIEFDGFFERNLDIVEKKDKE